MPKSHVRRNHSDLCSRTRARTIHFLPFDVRVRVRVASAPLSNSEQRPAPSFPLTQSGGQPPPSLSLSIAESFAHLSKWQALCWVQEESQTCPLAIVELSGKQDEEQRRVIFLFPLCQLIPSSATSCLASKPFLVPTWPIFLFWFILF